MKKIKKKSTGVKETYTRATNLAFNKVVEGLVNSSKPKSLKRLENYIEGKLNTFEKSNKFDKDVKMVLQSFKEALVFDITDKLATEGIIRIEKSNGKTTIVYSEEINAEGLQNN